MPAFIRGAGRPQIAKDRIMSFARLPVAIIGAGPVGLAAAAHILAHASVKVTAGQSCCGGPASAEVDACRVGDAEAKAASKSGCGCAPEPEPMPGAARRRRR